MEMWSGLAFPHSSVPVFVDNQGDACRAAAPTTRGGFTSSIDTNGLGNPGWDKVHSLVVSLFRTIGEMKSFFA